MEKEEIKDMLDIHSKEEMVNYIYELEQKYYRTKRALETAQMLIRNSVTKDRYNNIVKKYNNLIKKEK